jgi:S1-C subfamily serine protease
VDARIGQVVLVLGRMSAGSAAVLGTCFAVGPKYFATAAHVTGPSDEGLIVALGKTSDIADYQDTTDSTARFAPVKIVNYDPVRDVCILAMSDGTVQFGYALTGSDDVRPGDAVVSLGYPHADHGRVVLTQQNSAVGARVLLGAHGTKTKHIVLNTQTRPGQSGGPVFTSDGRRVCAMVVGGYTPMQGGSGISLGGIDPQTLHQTTHAVSAEYIRALL